MNFRGLAISKRLILTWLLIIAIDLLAGLFFFHLTYNREDIVVGYSILFTVFWSAIAGIIFLFISNTRQLGICLLLNIFVIYFIFDFTSVPLKSSNNFVNNYISIYYDIFLVESI